MKLILLVVALLVPSNTLSFTVPSQKVKVQHDISQKMTTSRLDEDGLKMFENWLPIGMTRSTPKDNVIIDADYRLTGVFTLASLLIYYLYPATTYYPGYEEPVYFLTFSGLSALVHLWFGLFLADRAYRIRCVFDNECFQMKNYRDAYGNPRDEILMEQRTKNYVVGGANKWRYDSFVNYDFWPSIHVPVLVYFKEDQTPKEKWSIGPGGFDPRPGTGMVHFFPGFANPYQLEKEFQARGCSKKK